MSGKIYKLSLPDGSYYFGSTFYSVEETMAHHKIHSKGNTKRKVYKRINELGGWNNVTVEVIKEYDNITEKELRKLEDDYIKPSIKDKLCLNRNRNRITEEERLEYFKQYKINNADEIKMKEILRNKTEKRKTYKKNYSEDHKIETSLRNKEYRETHAEELSDKRLQRYELNRDKILVEIREKTTCDCGGIFRKRDIRRHERSDMHQRWLMINQTNP